MTSPAQLAARSAAAWSSGRPPAPLVVAVAAAGLVAGVAGLLPLAGGGGATSGQRSVLAAASVVATAGAALVLHLRARAPSPESDVWRWFAWAASALAAGTAVDGVLLVVGPGGAGGSPHGVAAGVGAVLACPPLYQGLVHWNRYRTLVTDPGDWLNGVSAVLAFVALGDLVVARSGSPLADSSGWDLQGWFFRAGAVVVLLGTTATVMSMGGLVRDRRVWALAGALGLVLLGELAPLAGERGGLLLGALSQVAWVLLPLVLAGCSLVAPGPVVPRRATTQAPTIGALVVLLAGVAVLAVEGGFSGRGSRLPTTFAVLAVLGVGARLVQLVVDLAQLAKTRQEALTDELTGAPNRRALLARLEDVQVPRPAPSGGAEGTSLLLVDLDRFKDVNDRYGHAVGDELLRRVTTRLAATVPGDGLLARLGGDEFAVLLPATSTGAAVVVARAVVESTREVVDVDGRLLRVGASVGVASSAGVGRPGGHGGGDQQASGGELLRRADAAMYVAKASGGGVSVYDGAADAALQERAGRLEDLRAALAPAARGEPTPQVVVVYQPQLDVRTGAVRGVEALVRWQHPRLGLLGPDHVVPLAEEHGLMAAVTTAVLRQATAQAARWRAQGWPLRLSVNLSTSCLTQPGLLPLVDDVLATTGTDPATLTLELTETTLMSDPDQAMAAVQALADRGIGVSIDDYGTGYSSLSYLASLPATELKLDRSFVSRLLAQPRTAAIVQGTVDLAHALDLRVVAEGVEDAATHQRLRELGCDESQGFWHARPLPAAELTAWLAQRPGPSRSPRPTGDRPAGHGTGGVPAARSAPVEPVQPDAADPPYAPVG